MKKVILITSTYNGAAYLPQLLDSIFAQTYPELELVIRDDGSKDNTVEILRSYQQKAPAGKQITIMNDQTDDWENKGAHQSYHILIQNLKKADYYISCDQDDVWDPRKVERAVASMDQYPDDIPVLYTHNYYICDGNLTPQGTLSGKRSYTPEEMASVNLANVIMTGTWAGVGMAQAFNDKLKQLAYHSGNFKSSIALDCWIAWVVAGLGGALIYDKEPLAYYRRHEGTFSSGDANGIARYLDWKKHMKRHCANITNGIHDYHRLFGHLVSLENKTFLELFDSHKQFGKLIYPHRLRNHLLDEIAFRALILLGKI